MSLNGLKEILLGADPGTGINPDVGYIFKWIEKVGAEYIYKGKDSAGTVFNIGTTGGITQLWELFGEGVRPASNREVAIGQAGGDGGRELVAGEGDSYNSTGQLIVKSYNGTVYADETTNIQSEDANKLDFPNNNDGTIIYMASEVTSGGDQIKHPGVKIKVDTGVTLGAGDIVFEYYNGSAWTEFNHMITRSSRPFTHYANDRFTNTGSFQIRYDQQMLSDQVKTTVDGDNRFWIRWRISGGITTSFSIDTLKLHSNRWEANPDGFIEYFGSARAVTRLPVTWGSFQAANASPGNQDVYLADNIGVGRSENLFEEEAIDRQALVQFAPQNLDTSSKLKIVFSFAGDSSSSGDVLFKVRWAKSATGSDVYDNTGDAPGTAPGEKIFSGLFSFASNNDDIQKCVSVPIDFPSLLLDNTDSCPESLWVSFERTGTDGSDTYPGDVALIDVAVFYHQWCEGGHPDNF
jgi:hypothetical protein